MSETNGPTPENQRPYELTPEVFSDCITTFDELMGRLGSRPITYQEDLDTIASFPPGLPIEPDRVVGKRAELRVDTGRVSYEIALSFYGTAASLAWMPRIADCHINAIEGDLEDLQSIEHVYGRQDLGCVAGFLSFDAAGLSIDVDFDFGTRPSPNAEVQQTLAELVAHFGFDESEVFGADDLRYVYDDNRARRFAQGLRQFIDNPPR